MVSLSGCGLLEQTYSTHNNSPMGYGATFDLLEKLNLTPERWEKRYSELTEEPTGAMLLRVDEVVPLRPDLLLWVREGNTLIELENPTPLSPPPPDTRHRVPPGLGLHIPEAGIQTTSALGIDRMTLAKRIATVVDSEAEAGQSSLILGDNKQPLLIVQPLGEGLYIYGVIPDLAINRRLFEPENFQFLTNLIYRFRPSREAPLYFDEVIHGYGPQNQPESDGSSHWWNYFIASPLALIFGQAVLILVLWIVGRNQRLSPVQPSPEPVRASNLEYIEALAATYQRAGASRLILSLLLEDLRKYLTRKLGAIGTRDDQLLVTLWNQDLRRQNSTVQLQALLMEARSTTPLSPNDLLARVDIIHRLKQELKP
jgi:hypothetical protein